MSETRTVTTITFKRDSDPTALIAASVVVAVLVAVVLALAIFPEPLHFDGKIGSGCDAGNRLCTYREWRKGCSDEQVAGHVCNLAEYRREGGDR